MPKREYQAYISLSDVAMARATGSVEGIERTQGAYAANRVLALLDDAMLVERVRAERKRAILIG